MDRVEKSEASFEKGLRHAALAYFEQRIFFLDFVQELNRLLAFHYTQAWTEGEAAVGFTPAERTDQQRQMLQSQVAQSMLSADGLMTFIEAQTKAVQDGTKKKQVAWASITNRLNLWVNRYGAVRNLAQTVVGADKKLIWYLGQTERHCQDCANYEGRVYRASAWAAAGAMPQSSALECGGYNCDCQLVPTNALATPGFPPGPSGG